MELFSHLFNFILHIDQHLLTFVSTYGVWTYALLFLIIFCETGLVIIPFLPGDSLLFATGALTASTHSLNIHLLFILLVTASILGNSLNYFIGIFIGPKVFRYEQSWMFNKKYLKEAHRFYEKFGGKTIIIARFIPIIRTFAPFVAGIGYMSYRQFTLYNVIGALLWIGSLLYISYWFGNLEFIKEHLSMVILIIIGVTLLPPVIAFLRHAFFNPKASS